MNKGRKERTKEGEGKRGYIQVDFLSNALPDCFIPI